MPPTPPPSVRPEQQAVLDAWFPDGLEVVRDLSWGLVDTIVLHVRTAAGDDVVVNAGGSDDSHIGRELDGYAGPADVWTERDLAPRVLHGDRDSRLLAMTWLPGTLAGTTAYADDPDVHRQAGAALALLHGQTSRESENFDALQHQRCRELLDAPHRIDDAGVAWLRGWLEAHEPGPTTLVPTHGDYSPRNWLVDEAGRLRLIDLGRFAWRPAASDLCRLHSRHWRDRTDLAEAFCEGYGRDLRTDARWTAELVREALGTATWALAVGDEPFELEGHRMVADLVAGRR